MNYLAHAYFSYDFEDRLLGNIIGDTIKGSHALEELPSSVQKGVMLHRFIDEYTDKHPALLRAKNILRPEYRLYSGVFIDVMLDYFLANDPEYFNRSSDLLAFSKKVFVHLDQQKGLMPEKFITTYRYLKDDNWLYNIRTLKGLSRAVSGVAQRAVHLDNGNRAYELIVSHIYQMNQIYFEFIEDLDRQVKIKIDELEA